MKPFRVKIVSVIIILICTVELMAQDSKSVSGIITAFNQIPLIRVMVTSSKSGDVVYTDSLGRFSLKSSERDMLSVTAEGFQNKKIKVTKENVYIIDLQYKDNVNNFNKAVSSGHISEDVLRKAITMNELKYVKDYSKYSSIYELISTEIYNVRVVNNVVYNKKVRSFDSNPRVLYVVNDKVVSDISFVSPFYVKSIEFLDDAGSTMYGMMGANGVLKITLK